jgi:hypothetical protein
MHQGEIVHILVNINRKLDLMALDFTKLIADVTTQTTVVQSVVTLLVTLSADLKKALADLAEAVAANDPRAQAAAQAQIDSLATQLETNTQILADAVPVNTPAA